MQERLFFKIKKHNIIFLSKVSIRLSIRCFFSSIIILLLFNLNTFERYLICIKEKIKLLFVQDNLLNWMVDKWQCCHSSNLICLGYILLYYLHYYIYLLGHCFFVFDLLFCSFIFESLLLYTIIQG